MAASAVLHLAFQDGFESDRVTVDAGGAHHELEALRTRTQIGLADELDVDLAGGPVEVRVCLPDRRIEATTSGTVAAESWLGVSLVGDSIEFTWSEGPFRYA